MSRRAHDADPLAEALHRTAASFVALEVRSVLLDQVGPDVLAQVVYDLGAAGSSPTATMAAVHHSGHALPPPATYERVRSDAPFLAPHELGHVLDRHRGLRWLPQDDPASRAWPVGRRLLRLVDDEDAGRLLADHFAVPFVRNGESVPT